jgi:predicted Zn-dependent protease
MNKRKNWRNVQKTFTPRIKDTSKPTAPMAKVRKALKTVSLSSSFEYKKTIMKNPTTKYNRESIIEI